MHRSNFFASLRWWLGALLVAFVAGALAPAAALAQTTLSVDAALGKVYRPQTWVPVRLRLTNQGTPAKVEVRARFISGPEGVQEYHTPEITLPGAANDVRYLYVRAPFSYSNQPLTVELLRDGRQIYKTNPTLQMLSDGDWLVTAIGPDTSTASLNILSTVQMQPNPRNWNGSGVPPGTSNSAHVALLDPSLCPDRGIGLDGADMVLLTGVSATDLSPEQQTALRDYVYAGGTLVVTGGVNAGRFNAPFFQDLLPVKVTGAGTRSSMPDANGLLAGLPGGQFPVCLSTPKPDAEVKVAADGAPMIASARRGSGAVVFLAFDPAYPPFRDWRGLSDFWKRQLLSVNTRPSLVRAVSLADSRGGLEDGGYGSRYNGGRARLADAPFAIPQLDIPAFYVVALFLVAYIVFLVPVNYFFLKARDKKEYAWLTTPAIVLVFSFGAYMIGYGFKGGRTLVVKVGVMETHLNQDNAPSVFYAGLFSPRKTGYSVELPAGDPGTPNAVPALLFSEPDAGRGVGMRQVQSDQQKVPDFGIDMWAMRVLKLDGTIRFGEGKAFTGRLQRNGEQLTGTVVNNTPYTLEDCQLMAGSQITPVGDLPPGRDASITANLAATAPPTRRSDLKWTGNADDRRMKRAVLQALDRIPGGLATTDGAFPPQLVGWVREPVAPLQVNGTGAREQSKTLMIVHLQ